MTERARSVSLKDALVTGRIKLESYLGLPLGPDGVPLAHNILIHDESFLEAVNSVCELNQLKLFDLDARPDITGKLVEDPPVRGFGDTPSSLVICPIQPTTHNGVLAVFVVGLNPRRPYDAEYDTFLKGLTRTVSSFLASLLLVNEQKRLAGKAAEMEQRAMAMVEVSPVGSFLMDMKGEMLYVNDSVCLTPR